MEQPESTGAGHTSVLQVSSGGMLPAAELVEAYNTLIPNGAERLMALVERQAAHRQELERRLVVGEIQRAWWGLVAGFIVSLSFLAASVGLIIGGARVEGTILGTVDLVALAGVFVYGSVARRAANDRP